MSPDFTNIMCYPATTRTWHCPLANHFDPFRVHTDLIDIDGDFCLYSSWRFFGLFGHVHCSFHVACFSFYLQKITTSTKQFFRIYNKWIYTLNAWLNENSRKQINRKRSIIIICQHLRTLSSTKIAIVISKDLYKACYFVILCLNLNCHW